MGSNGIKNSDGCKVDILIAKHKVMLIIRPKVQRFNSTYSDVKTVFLSVYTKYIILRDYSTSLLLTFFTLSILPIHRAIYPDCLESLLVTSIIFILDFNKPPD